MTDLLGIGSSALAAYRDALNAVGENVANAQTPGYARRRVVLEEATVVATGDLAYRSQISFNGVSSTGVVRAWDAFKATEARFSASAAGRAEVREQWLTSVESALDDGPAGIGSSITGFFGAAASLASDPGDPLGRRSVLSALDNAAGAFRATAQKLARLSDGIGQSAELEVTALNNALAALANLNGAITPVAADGSARASLEDERDRLIDLIASKLDVSVSIDGHGRATIAPAGSFGSALLDADGPNLVTLVPAVDGRLSLQLASNGTTSPLPAYGGSLAGLVEVSSTVADRRAALDALAADFTVMVNNWATAGVDSNGNPGTALIDTPSSAASMQALVSDPALVPAADASGVSNGNLLALDAIRSAGNVESRWSSLVSAHAQMLASARSEASATAKWRDNSYAALDEVTGVDLDHEAAELLRFQQAYNASARIIQVARESMQALFDAL
ncbi:MAG TPA: flagellar hook-associated protein FlgK [Allosphingosinicella sp.]|nr:flagellar hook-associated protein FlgK [Allosphingosinicella sp.]